MNPEGKLVLDDVVFPCHVISFLLFEMLERFKMVEKIYCICHFDPFFLLVSVNGS